MLELNEKTKNNIENRTGIQFEDILSMDFEQIDERIETKIGKQLEYDINPDKRLIGRGSVYIALMRLLGIKEIDKKISRIR